MLELRVKTRVDELGLGIIVVVIIQRDRMS